MSPSSTASSTPVTVTVCATFQLSVVNVTLAGATVPSVKSLLDNPIVTLRGGLGVQDHGKGRGPTCFGRG